MAVLLICLSLYLLLLKREIRSIRIQLHEHEDGVEKPIDVVFLDKNLTNLAAEINDCQRLQKKNQIFILKREMRLKESISNISHDLRTPLTSILGYLQLLQKTELTEEQREYLDISLSRSRYLQALIQDFYEISLLETKSCVPNVKKIHLDPLLVEVVLSFTEQLEEKRIVPKIVYAQAPTYVMADEMMLKRIFTNIVSNALRYGTGELVIEIQESDENGIVLSFQNKVVQENQIDADRLFEKFYTADASRNQSGSGLGLYIVKLLAEKINGSVLADFRENRLTVRLLLMKV